MKALIVGCGYVGRSVAALLMSQGHEVHAWRRQPEEHAIPGVTFHTVDITDANSFNNQPPGYDWVVNTVSSSRGGAEQYEQVYYEGTVALLEWLKSAPPRKYVYTSSTSVYAQADGSVVKETSPTEPETDTAKILLRTEAVLLKAFADAKFPAVILRVAGIYGPDRGHHFHQYLKNEARIAGEGTRVLNMIHREDLAGIIVRALQSGRPGEIYNVVDDEPVSELHFFRWLSETLGKWMPPSVTAEQAKPGKRGVTNKKVSNRRLKAELGYLFKYPTFRQGYTAEILALEKAGLLNIDPEQG